MPVAPEVSSLSPAINVSSLGGAGQRYALDGLSLTVESTGVRLPSGVASQNQANEEE
jgi:hypothetical protein